MVTLLHIFYFCPRAREGNLSIAQTDKSAPFHHGPECFVCQFSLFHSIERQNGYHGVLLMFGTVCLAGWLPLLWGREDGRSLPASRRAQARFPLIFYKNWPITLLGFKERSMPHFKSFTFSFAPYGYSLKRGRTIWKNFQTLFFKIYKLYVFNKSNGYFLQKAAFPFWQNLQTSFPKTNFFFMIFPFPIFYFYGARFLF